MASQSLGPPAREQGDAICFTSGPSGAAFSAGVIHAWLAADRAAPLVAAGVSMGSVSAAALEFCYRELNNARSPGATHTLIEQKRWEWYRRYLSAVTENPLKPIWESIPDPVDFRSTGPPVRDLSAPVALVDQEAQARRHYHILTKLGVWLAGIPVRASNIATIAVMFVRRKERYGVPLSTWFLFYWNQVKTAAGLLWHFLRAPNFIVEIESGNGGSEVADIHPLFGWKYWLGAWGVVAVAAGLAIIATIVCRMHLVTHPWPWCLGIAAAYFAFPLTMFSVFKWRCERDEVNWFQELIAPIFEELGLVEGLLHPYHVCRKIYDLFGDSKLNGSDSVFPVLVVCAALEQTEQVWPPDGTIYDRLTAALSLPGLFPPAKVAKELLANVNKSVLSETEGGYELSIIDGSSVRSNPIPAFFEWCKDEKNRRIVDKLEREDWQEPSLHVVYSVPIEPVEPADQAPGLDNFDIVEAAQLALELEKRRDTRQEVNQTNFTSRLELIRRRATTGTAKTLRGPFTIFADEIAPRDVIKVGSNLKPDKQQLLVAAANGCKETLQSLYRDHIPKQGCSNCMSLLVQIAPLRKIVSTEKPGVYELCNACDGLLRWRPAPDPEAPPNGIIRSYGLGPGDAPAHCVAAQHTNLQKMGRIVFLGSGGVFRGAFHIGVLGALQVSRLFPDLVIGASVGALMGGTLANLATCEGADEIAVLENLALVFLTVDTSVALTRTLKNAAKQIGTRARLIRLSPSELRKRVLRGTQADPGYAATGAPPVLIDAISALFEIPHKNTATIASQFVAGHITTAVERFLKELRKETLASFEIKNHLMGVDLLSGVAKRLLGYERDGLQSTSLNRSHLQPYHAVAEGKNPVSLFATTSFLNGRVSLLLGRDFLDPAPTWDGLYAGLSSSAFPAVFAPRSESDLLPGRGRTDRLFGDGGMFDNLPFQPAYEVLGVVQVGSAKACHSLHGNLCQRADNPDLFIAAGLDARPNVEYGAGQFNSLAKIRDRAKTLSIESKSNTYSFGAAKTRAAMRDIGASNITFKPNDDAFLQKVVSSYVLNISPKDKRHINPTFAFCRSMGLDKERVRRSIGDGCYQSLQQLASDTFAQRIIANRQLVQIEGPREVKRSKWRFLKKRWSSLTRKYAGAFLGAPSRKCPFFSLGDTNFDCPFGKSSEEDVAEIWSTCSDDHSME